MKLVSSKPMGKRRVYDIEVADVHNFYANGVNVHNCATEGGVSVIKDDGTVVDLTYTVAGNNEAEYVLFTEDGGIWWGSRDTGAAAAVYIQALNAIPTADRTTAPDAIYAPTNSTSAGNAVDFMGISQGVTALVEDAVGQGVGLSLIAPDTTVPSEGMVSYITSTYNTGWMNGDIKLATLSDTDDTDLVGVELITNGTFDTDVSGWSAGAYGTTLSVNSGALRITNGGDINGRAISDEFNTTIGKTYVVSVTGVAKSSATYRLEVRSGVEKVRTWSTDGETVYVTFTAVQSATHIELYAIGGASGPYVEYDNVSVRLAEPDRSVNGNGLQVFGTVTKEPVATGADLVAYSGFTTSNYLQQPYNSDLDFGTGDFCIMGWVKSPLTGTFGAIISRTDAIYSDEFIIMRNSTGKISVYDGNSSSQLSGNTVFADGTWKLITLLRASGMMSLYINGVLDVQKASTSSLSFSTGLQVGRRDSATDYSPFVSGSSALLRISATAPTAEQIAKIYRDEKVLFQEGAQATLHGTSDAVTALAYDDSTDLLHVGTSAGRSVFSGLQRVDNTTDAVGTAISASNGLVVEE